MGPKRQLHHITTPAAAAILGIPALLNRTILSLHVLSIKNDERLYSQNR